MGVGMSDYKEIARDLDIWIKDAENDELTPPIVLRKCKYAIEQLVKERDAAVDDISKYGKCCKNCVHGSNGKDDCLDDRYSPCEWEWRGVREVEHG